MKTRIFVLFLTAVMALSLSACNLAAARGRMDTMEGRIGQTLSPGTSASAPTSLTAEEAAAIALEHAGFTADQVQFLRTAYDWDDGVPEYEVSFHVDRWEYEYDIDAETGAIRSHSRDD